MGIEVTNSPKAVRVRAVLDDGKVLETDEFILIRKVNLEDGDFSFTSDLHLSLTLHELERLADFVHECSQELACRYAKAVIETVVNIGEENVG